MYEDTKVLDDILRSLGPMLGTDFNEQILGLIDTALLPLAQAGAIKKDQGSITADTTWSKVINDPNKDISISSILSSVRTYIYLQVRIMFDPPASSIVQIMKSSADEHLWRIRQAYEEVPKDE